MEKKLIIIGAGVAGLSAGVYARKCGFDTTIIESHSIPGGLCTSWKRKGYRIEGAIHWLSGTASTSPFNKFWRETGALSDDVHVFNYEPFLYTNYEGTDWYLYRDLQRLEEHFIQNSPEDAEEIKKFCKYVRQSSLTKMPIPNVKGVKLAHKEKGMSIFKIFSILPEILRVGKFSKITAKDYVEKHFKHKGLQQVLLADCPTGAPFTILLWLFAIMCCNDGGYPEGGAIAMAERMTDKFKSLGGKLIFNTKVEKIIIEKGVVKGVKTGDKILETDCVVPANDTITAVNSLFDFEIKDKWVKRLKENSTLAACTFAGIGVKADMSKYPHRMFMKLTKPVEIAGETICFLNLYNYAEHKSYAPEGCSTLTTIIGDTDTYDWWKKVEENGTYKEEKEKIKQILTEILAEHFPEIREKIEMLDVATPLTYERYTNAWRGSYMGKTEVGSKQTAYPCTLENVSGLVFAGQRLMFAGGLPPAVATGRQAVQMLCKEYDVVFQNNQ